MYFLLLQLHQIAIREIKEVQERLAVTLFVSVTWKCFDALISTGGTWIDTADGHKVILALPQVRAHFIFKTTPSPLLIKTNPYILPVLQS